MATRRAVRRLLRVGLGLGLVVGLIGLGANVALADGLDRIEGASPALPGVRQPRAARPY